MEQFRHTLSIVFYISLIFPFMLEILKVIFLEQSFKEYSSIKEPYFKLTFDTAALAIFYLLYLLLCIVGLFSSSWFFFLPIIFLGLFIKKNKWHYALDSLFCAFLLVFIILNRFYFNWLI